MDTNKSISAGQSPVARPVIDSYARLSWKPDSTELEKIEDQHGDNRQVIKRAGGGVGVELSDGESAWKKDAKRPGWDQILERLRTGQSQGVCVWHTDRLLRAPRDLETLIDLGDKGYRILSAWGEYDLSNSDHRFILRIKTAQAAKESDDKSRRIKRRLEGKRERGIKHEGAREFGFPGGDLTWTPPEDDPEAVRPQVSPELVQRERAALKEGAEALLAGMGQMTIAELWNKAEMFSPRGLPWVAAMVRTTLQRGSLAGFIEHDGKIVGRIKDFEPIITEEQFYQIRALFAGRRRGRPSGQVHLASGILRCARCYRTMGGHTKSILVDGTRVSYYECAKTRRGCGKTYAPTVEVDQELRNLVIVRLSDKRRTAAVNAARAQSRDRLAEIEAKLAQINEIQVTLTARLAEDELSLEAYTAANDPLGKRRAKLIKERDSLPGRAAVAEVTVMTRQEVADKWDRAGVSAGFTTKLAERRAMLKEALEGQWVVVEPSGQRKSVVFDPKRVYPCAPRED